MSHAHGSAGSLSRRFPLPPGKLQRYPERKAGTAESERSHHSYSCRKCPAGSAEPHSSHSQSRALPFQPGKLRHETEGRETAVAGFACGSITGGEERLNAGWATLPKQLCRVGQPERCQLLRAPLGSSRPQLGPPGSSGCAGLGKRRRTGFTWDAENSPSRYTFQETTAEPLPEATGETSCPLLQGRRWVRLPRVRDRPAPVLGREGNELFPILTCESLQRCKPSVLAKNRQRAGKLQSLQRADASPCPIFPLEKGISSTWLYLLAWDTTDPTRPHCHCSGGWAVTRGVSDTGGVPSWSRWLLVTRGGPKSAVTMMMACKGY